MLSVYRWDLAAPLAAGPYRAIISSTIPQDIVSWKLAAIFLVTALRATRMWREKTNYGALLNLQTAAAVCVPAAVNMFTVEKGRLREEG